MLAQGQLALQLARGSEEQQMLLLLATIKPLLKVFRLVTLLTTIFKIIVISVQTYSNFFIVVKRRSISKSELPNHLQTKQVNLYLNLLKI